MSTNCANRMTVNILGTEYTIAYGNEKTNTGLIDNDGYTDTSTKEIFINDMSYMDGDDVRKRDMEAYKRKVLRHEITHAFFAESGLDGSGHSTMGCFEHDEELVDWIAIQGVKIYKAWESVGAV